LDPCSFGWGPSSSTIRRQDSSTFGLQAFTTLVAAQIGHHLVVKFALDLQLVVGLLTVKLALRPFFKQKFIQNI